jgi:phage baseplate assembly protein gpV
MADVVRCGKVSSINYEAGTFEVTYDDRSGSVTGTINPISNGLYRMPKVGDLVNVLHNSNGTEEGTSLGTIWCKENKPAEGAEGLWRQEYDAEYGKAYFRYDGQSEKSSMTLPGDLTLEVGDSTVTIGHDGNVTIKASNKLTIEVGGSTVTLNQSGSVTISASGSMTLDTPKASFTGNVDVSGNITATGNVTATGEVKAGIIALTTHKHISNVTGVPSQVPMP